MSYGSASWVMTSTRGQLLRSTRMKMMRATLVRKRLVHPDGEGADLHEPSKNTWVEWVRSVTGEVGVAMKKHGVPDWVEKQKRGDSKVECES